MVGIRQFVHAGFEDYLTMISFVEDSDDDVSHVIDNADVGNVLMLRMVDMTDGYDG